jgi:2',3'-cyclic-nucleotide 2'-phosphodiesterase (5'-nucleotidase family)
MRQRYADVDVGFVNSGGLRADLVVSPPSAGEQAGEITRGEMLMVLPFGNRTVILTVTGDQLEAALLNGFAPSCDPSFPGGTFRFPQLSGLKVVFHCDGVAPVVDGMWETPEGAGGSEIPIGPADTVRIVTLDYLLAGGDGYSMFEAGRNVRQPGDALLDVAADYVAAHSPVAPAVDGRILGP